MRRRFLEAVIGFGAGIIAGRYFPVSLEIWAAAACCAILLTLGCYLFIKKYDLQGRGRAILLSALLLGAFWYALGQYPGALYPELAGQNVSGQGMIISYPKSSGYSLSFAVSVDKLQTGQTPLKNLKKLQLRVRTKKTEDFMPGTVISFRGTAEIPSVARNPGGFDYRGYLANQGIFYQVDCAASDVCAIAESGGLRRMAAGARQRMHDGVIKMLPPRESGLLLGFLFGDTAGISAAEWEIYQRAGVLHLFSVSGLHVAFLLGTVYFLLSFLTAGLLPRAVCGTAALILYYFLLGWKVSFVRAAVMVFLGLSAALTGRRKDAFTSMALAAAVILIIQPGELFQIGFQLSFAATAGIVYFAPWLESYRLGKALSIALAAQAFTLPLIAWYFNLISLVSPLLNIVAVAASALIAALGLIGALLLCIFPMPAEPFLAAAGFLLYLLSELVLKAASFEWAALVVRSPSLPLVVACYALLTILPKLPHRRPYLRFLGQQYLSGLLPKARRPWAAAGAALVLLVVLLGGLGTRGGGMEVIFLDVGQGDSIFIRTPQGITMLIDGGGTPASDYSVGQRVIRPFLQKQGLEKIDLMVMTHKDLDHSEGLLELLPTLKVGAFLMPPREGNDETEVKLLAACQEYAVPVKELTVGEKVQLGRTAWLEVLNPEKGDKDKGNNHSLVLRLVYGETAWLLTGDVEKKVLAEMMSRPGTLGADVLKLPHHGSVGSFDPDFYEAVSPRAVVVSAGVNNYNHPHPQVLQYFTDKGIPFYLTKNSGAVITRSDGATLSIETYLQQ
ncbi:MAG: DNA internalization-related competence protein ComEC/Rec2 [Clostridia bacterium]|jgi:competence protein ComEC|nr:DNA internalization-related competence protein ComEC/Rec2 [Clostridia bacterium]